MHYDCDIRSLVAGNRRPAVELESNSLSQAAQYETTDLRAVPACLPAADVDVRLRTTDQAYRIGLAAFEVLRGLAEPTGLSGLRSDI